MTSAGVLALAAAVAAAATGPARSWVRARAAREIERRFPAVRVTGELAVDRTLRVSASGVAVLGREDAPPVATVRSVAVRLRPLPLLRGRVEIASVALEGVRVDAGPAASRLAELRRALPSPESARGPGRGGATPPRVVFSDATVALVTSAGEPIALGPFAGEVAFARQGGGTVVHAAVRSATAASADAELRLGAEGGVRLWVRDLGVEDLPARVREHLPVAVEGGRADLAADVRRLGRSGTAHLDLAARGLTVRAAPLAAEAVGPATFRASGTLAWDLDAGRFTLEDGQLSAGPDGRATVSLAADVQAGPEPAIAFTARVDRLDWRAAVAALPAALAPPPDAPAVRGEVTGWLSVSGPIHHPDAWRIDGDLDPSALERDRDAGPALPLDRSFRWQAPLPDGGVRTVVVGPENPAYVPLGELPTHVVRAVMASEDAGFFAHHGFDLREVQDALARSDGHRLRGASTITQQLAKNLFLTPERTLARKVREALATVALEASTSKRRLLEIYLNIAEWGPGVYGIGEAARHWFDKDARELTPKEAAFLASVIPNPVRYEMYRRRGALTERWEERVRDVLVKLREADVLTDDQLYEAWTAPLGFPPG